MYFSHFYVFLRERKRERVRVSRGEAERERGGQRIPGRLRADSTEPDAGLELTNCEIVTGAKAGRSND